MIRVFLVRGAVTLALFVALVALRLHDYYPPLPNPLTLELELDSADMPRAGPVIVTGRTGAADFLSVRGAGEDTVQFVYDSWAFPGIASEPVRIQPGARLRLTIEMPALDQLHGTIEEPSRRVRVTCDGVTVLDTRGEYYPREPRQVWFGENALGGTACGPSLHGRLYRAGGRPLRGGAGEFFDSRRERLLDWLARFPWQAVVFFVGSAAIVFGPGAWRPFLHRWRARCPGLLDSALAAFARHRWFIGGTTLCAFAFAWLVTLGSFSFSYGEVFGSFYDYQAASFLQGRLDVPEDAIGGEAFESGGRLYGYFGPTPALLRLPFVVSGFAFGKLSRAFMLLYYVASLVAAYLILREALRALQPGPVPAADLVPTPFATVVLLLSAGLGSTMFFVGSRGFIFHEAILGGIVFALWSCWCALRHLREPERRWWIGALICGILSVHTRPPTGLFALTFLGCVALAAAFARGGIPGFAAADPRSAGLRPLRRAIGIGALCAAGFLSLNGFAWLKFGTFDAAPLRLSRPYTDPGRLEHIEGRSFHLANLPYNIHTYLLNPNFRLEPRFPWIYLGSGRPPREFPGAKIDLPDHTLAVPYSMPSLFALATLGCAVAFAGLPRLRLAIGALWLAVAPMTLALFAAVATAQRYTGDFCPFLIAAAACGLAGVEHAAPRWRASFRALLVVLTLGAIAITAAITVHYQGATLWGVPEHTRENYQQLRQRVDSFFDRSPPSATARE